MSDADEVNETPGSRLRAARIAAGYRTIAEAARAHRLHAQNLADHEAGRRKISAEHAQTYGEAFDNSASWILFGTADIEADLSGHARLVAFAGFIRGGYYEPRDEEWSHYIPVSTDHVPRLPLVAYKVIDVDETFAGSLTPGTFVIAADANAVGLHEGDTVVVKFRRAGLVKTTLRVLGRRMRGTTGPAADLAQGETFEVVAVVVQKITPVAYSQGVALGESELLLR